MAFDPDDRDTDIKRFLEAAGWGGAERCALNPDASTRRYERLTHPDGATAMLMDAPGRGEDPPCPPGASEDERRLLGWNAMSRLAASRVDAFVPIAAYLERRGYSPPRVLASDLDRGLAVLEDFGDRLFADLLARGEADEVELYSAAGELLADVHAEPSPAAVEGGGASWPLLDYDAMAFKVNVALFGEWMPRFEPGMRRDDALIARYEVAADALIEALLDAPKAFTLRDYHAENLLWLPERAGHARIGLLDFQDAVRGPRVWDISMLLHDARRDVSPAARAAMIRAYLEAAGGSEAELQAELAVAGAVNTLRILGLFVRLVARDKKDRYRTFIPREWGHLAETLSHPAAAEMAAVVDDMLPDWRRLAA
ncbi:MAG: phosphotransferase [Pseudomonadota bacterium]